MENNLPWQMKSVREILTNQCEARTSDSARAHSCSTWSSNEQCQKIWKPETKGYKKLTTRFGIEISVVFFRRKSIECLAIMCDY